MNAVTQPWVERTDRGTGLWGTIDVWSQALGVPAWQLRERLEDYPSQPTWVHEEEFEYVTDSYLEADVLAACEDLLVIVAAA
jgi:hypothetical protein